MSVLPEDDQCEPGAPALNINTEQAVGVRRAGAQDLEYQPSLAESDENAGYIPVNDEVSPEERLLIHPLFGEPAIKSAPTLETYHACRERLLNGTTAFTVLGKPGMDCRGALRVIRQYLKQEYPHLTTFEHTVSRFRSARPYVVLSSLLNSVKHGVAGGSPEAQMSRLVNMQEERALISGFPRSVWILHNVELIGFQTCQIMLDMRDRLALKGIRLFLVNGAFAEPFMTQIASFSSVLSGSEIQTVFGSIHPLRGLSGLQEYAEVLMEIDSMPIRRDSPITWTESLLPLAFRNGFRLTKHAPAIHAAITARMPLGNFPDRSFLDVVRNVLSVSARNDAPDFDIPPMVWENAVDVVIGIGNSYLQAVGAGLLSDDRS
ncbi:hypothetical protein [Caballeronia sordidicola]|uniref:Uncharacterized protein n=1 Tax=Caballeronia sordidicola TaxID=196367 RepID=A0A226WYI9_CABSO|nr:hypothetical protein [Caballeronia sordidicola]OXC76251.1 hypothetical protein BSU04_22925 [Caballeronia sordidicola]